jgi:hypothetical protein
MKKSTYPLLAILILCLVGIAVLFSMNQNKQRQIDDLTEQLASLTLEKDGWENEKLQWAQDKANMSESLGLVHAALSRTLLDIQGISTSLDNALAAVGDAYTQAGMPAGTTPLPRVNTTPSPAEEEAEETAKPATTPTQAPSPATESDSTPTSEEKPAEEDANETTLSPDAEEDPVTPSEKTKPVS